MQHYSNKYLLIQTLNFCFIYHFSILSNQTFEQIAANTYWPSSADFPPSSYPYITGVTVRERCDHRLDPISRLNVTKIKPGDTIFVTVNFLEYFFTNYHANLPPYILVTHHFYGTSDDNFPGKFGRYLEDQQLIAWFTHNIDRHHHKLHPLPIGIGDTSRPGNKNGICERIKKEYKEQNFTKKLLYLCCTIHTHPEREVVYNLFKSKKFCSTENYKPMEEYFKDLMMHKFVLSPRGNGLDCFRTWEALIMGSYPIVKTSTLDELFQDLPVLIINDWTEITEDFLNKKYSELSSKKDYIWEKLYMPYWLDKIYSMQKPYRT